MLYICEQKALGFKSLNTYIYNMYNIYIYIYIYIHIYISYKKVILYFTKLILRIQKNWSAL